MKKEEIDEQYLDMFFLLNPEDHSMYLKDENNDYVFEEGIEGAEIFTREEIKELLNDPENEGFEVDVITVKDALINEDLIPENYEVIL